MSGDGLYGVLGGAGLAVFALGVLMSIVVHEVAHGVASDALGDPTPRRAGRLTLDPRRHLTLWGVVFPVILYNLGLPAIGWAKPVPVDPRHYPDPRRGLMLVALAGPASNVVIAFLLSPVAALAPLPEGVAMAVALLIVVNVALALFNMIPAPPLDGSKVLQLALPRRLAYRYLAASRVTVFAAIGTAVILPGVFRSLLNTLFGAAVWGMRALLGLWGAP